MAIGFSNEYLKKYTQGRAQDRLRMIIKLGSWTMKYRKIVRAFTKKKIYESKTECHITKNFNNASKHFQEHGWVLLENYLSPEFYKELSDQWPKPYELDVPKKLTKSYDTSPSWLNGQKDLEIFHKHQAFQKLLDYHRSEKFTHRMTSFVGRDVPFLCYSFGVSTAYVGSQVVPHKDGIYNDSRTKNFLNILIFINGKDEKRSGGLVLSKDNELNDIIVEPTKLHNTALIYDSKADFYHGFKPLKKDAFRWAIASQFCEESFIQD